MNKESFAKLVLDMRVAEKAYWKSREKEDLHKSLSLERQVDIVLEDTMQHLAEHKEYVPTTANAEKNLHWQLFILTNELRKETKNYFSHKKAHPYPTDEDKAVNKANYRNVKHYESQVDHTLDRISDEKKMAAGYKIRFVVCEYRPAVKQSVPVYRSDNERMAHAECYNLNCKAAHGCYYFVAKEEIPPQCPPQPQQQELAFQ